MGDLVCAETLEKVLKGYFAQWSLQQEAIGGNWNRKFHLKIRTSFALWKWPSTATVCERDRIHIFEESQNSSVHKAEQP